MEFREIFFIDKEINNFISDAKDFKASQTTIETREKQTIPWSSVLYVKHIEDGSMD